MSKGGIGVGEEYSWAEVGEVEVCGEEWEIEVNWGVDADEEG